MRLIPLALAVAAAASFSACGGTADIDVSKLQLTEKVAASAEQSKAIADAANAIYAACANGQGDAGAAPHVATIIEHVNAVRLDSPMALDNSGATPRMLIGGLISSMAECAPEQAAALERGTGIEPQ